MTIAELTRKMINFYKGNKPSVSHTMKVWGYAKTIGELEGLDEDTQFLTEVAAIVHDLSIPFCREKYGDDCGSLQEKEGPAITVEFLADTGLSEDAVERLAYLVGHHHSPEQIDGIDYQILIEADYLVNADEWGYSDEDIRMYHDKIFKTASGTSMLEDIFIA